MRADCQDENQTKNPINNLLCTKFYGRLNVNACIAEHVILSEELMIF